MGILDTLKDVVTLVQKTDNIELVKQVLALQLTTIGWSGRLRECVLGRIASLLCSSAIPIRRYWAG